MLQQQYWNMIKVRKGQGGGLGTGAGIYNVHCCTHSLEGHLGDDVTFIE